MLPRSHMVDAPRSRDAERGSTLIVALITLTALFSIGSVAMLAVKSEMSSVGQTRIDTETLYAAESGAAAALEYLRGQCGAGGEVNFSAFVNQSNANPQHPPGIMGNLVQPGAVGYPFPPGTLVWYDVSILNNKTDTGFASAGGVDNDARVTLHVVGHGPNRTAVTIEVEVYTTTCPVVTPLLVMGWRQL